MRPPTIETDNYYRAKLLNPRRSRVTVSDIGEALARHRVRRESEPSTAAEKLMLEADLDIEALRKAIKRREAAARGRLLSGSPAPTRPEPWACEVCGTKPPRRVLHLDHCHQTGVFRGWLCHGCNLALGFMKDSPTKLRALADYLERQGAA